jgi:UDP-N-acetylmuramate--alanine ligase
MVGVDAATIARSLESFTGTRRRFEIRLQGPLVVAGNILDIMLVDDYAHHPTAIAATIEAARRRYPGWRIVAVYQPHMYSRTKTFFAQFLHAFDAADVVIIADIFPARERDTGLIHARDLVAAIAQLPVFTTGTAQVIHGGNVAETTGVLRTILRPHDMAIIMGAGDIYTVTETLLHDEANKTHSVSRI